MPSRRLANQGRTLTGPPRRDRGFTLIEVIVATVLLALGLIGALMAFSLAARATGAARTDTLVPLLAEQKLSGVKALPRDELQAGTYEGDFGDEHPGYRWTMTIQPEDDLHVVAVVLVVHAPGQGHGYDVTFATQIF